MKAIHELIGLALIPLLSGCVSAPFTSVAVAPVGPNPESPRSLSAQGQLEVFSRLTRRSDDQNQDSTYPVWYQHTDYFLCDQNGMALQRVFNAAGHFEPDPKIVNLPAGKYIVDAEAAPDYWIKVPVTIKSGATTRVHLDGKWTPPSYSAKTQIVTLPNGKPVGWGM